MDLSLGHKVWLEMWKYFFHRGSKGMERVILRKVQTKRVRFRYISIKDTWGNISWSWRMTFWRTKNTFCYVLAMGSFARDRRSGWGSTELTQNDPTEVTVFRRQAHWQGHSALLGV